MGRDHITKAMRFRRLSVLGIVGGAAVGGSVGFLVRGYFGSQEVLGFGNMADQFGKLVLWTVVGLMCGMVGGVAVVEMIGKRLGPGEGSATKRGPETPN